MNSKLSFGIVNDYSSKAEELLLATEVNRILLSSVLSPPDHDCSSGTQGVGDNIEVIFNVAGAWADRWDFCSKWMRIGVLAAPHAWHYAP